MTTTEQDYNTDLKKQLQNIGIDQNISEILLTLDSVIKRKVKEAERKIRIATILQALPFIIPSKQNSRDLGDIFKTSHRTIQLWIKEGAKDYLIENQKDEG